MHQQILEIDGLRTTVVGATKTCGTMVVLLHGFAMTAADLAPFAHSLRLPALFVFPEGPLPGGPSGRAWFPMDIEARRAAQQHGPRDLVDSSPSGLSEARERLGAFLRVTTVRFQPERIVLGGFSQGAMLACDLLLHEALVVNALLLMSASRLAVKDWQSRRERLQSLPVLVSHGERDTDLAFSAGVGLRDFVVAAGATVTWVPFDGGHEIPLVVWRAIRKFLRPFTAP
jgi:phospholipase/carboxylesterase